MNTDRVSYSNAPLATDVNTVGAAISAVSWGAIFAGAAAGASLSLILLMLGTGLGLSSVSPWLGSGIGIKTLGVSTIVWIIFTQLAAAALGGYIAGRMRTRWLNVAVDEVYFRDTAHGFLTWSIATLFTAALLTSTISAVLGGAADTTISAMNSPMLQPAKPAAVELSMPGNSYALDRLFRKADSADNTQLTPEPNTATVAMPQQRSSSNMAVQDSMLASAEVSRIFAYTQSLDSSVNSALSADDLRYAAQLVAQQTGLGYSEAETRVTNSYTLLSAQAAELKTSAKMLADTARKSAAQASLWLFISLLIGAFIASFSATIGAKHRDD